MGIVSEHVSGPPGSVWSSTSRLSNEAELGQQLEAELGQQLQAEYQEVVSKTAA